MANLTGVSTGNTRTRALIQMFVMNLMGRTKGELPAHRKPGKSVFSAAGDPVAVFSALDSDGACASCETHVCSARASVRVTCATLRQALVRSTLTSLQQPCSG
jgi:hypothetical protein